MSDLKLKTVQLAIGLDLIGSKTSLQAGRNYDLTATQIGVICHSKGSGRAILIPWPNVKGCELLVEPVVGEADSKKKK